MEKKHGKWADLLKSDKGKKILAVGIAVAILLIFLSEFLPRKEKTDHNPQNTQDTAAYSAALESRMLSVLESISGVGSARVMITLEGGTQNVYATEKKETQEKDETVGGDSRDTKERNDTQQSYIIIDTGDGEDALLETTISPKISGVVIVCDGGDQAPVRERIINAVTVALGIRSNQVYVTKKK